LDKPIKEMVLKVLIQTIEKVAFATGPKKVFAFYKALGLTLEKSMIGNLKEF
jgi:hypothetical protein